MIEVFVTKRKRPDRLNKKKREMNAFNQGYILAYMEALNKVKEIYSVFKNGEKEEKI